MSLPSLDEEDYVYVESTAFNSSQGRDSTVDDVAHQPPNSVVFSVPKQKRARLSCSPHPLWLVLVAAGIVVSLAMSIAALIASHQNHENLNSSTTSSLCTSGSFLQVSRSET
ncbi:hypothetical protein [Cycloclasticus sp.]|uniref:hypothetical protein n=1 Tax=Cycloclasticus sp. TaxID=2024830 RepID=UPI00257A377A|nr:hypothetical protein [Cycloclasticus sp.]